jgi:GTP cyclohydrolase I
MIKNEEFQDEIGDNHVSLSQKNPVDMMLDLSDDEIKKKMLSILSTLGMDLTDDSLKARNRVAKMFVKKFWRFKSFKKTQSIYFDNNYKYGEMLVKHNCLLYLRHHLLLITKAA